MDEDPLFHALMLGTTGSTFRARVKVRVAAMWYLPQVTGQPWKTSGMWVMLVPTRLFS